MASLLRQLSHLRSDSVTTQNAFSQPNRRYHIDLGQREKALLAEDQALSLFKSHKQGVKRVKRIGDVLTIIVVAGCCYEIYVRTTMREEARKQEKSSH